MEKEKKTGFKKRLLLHCQAVIQSRIDTALQLMQNAQDAANGEEKSSAGDKYETGRAMSHLEKDMHAKQLVANQHELAALMEVNCDKLHAVITNGSIVICDEASFFIAAGIGKLPFENEIIFAVSPQAPLAKVMWQKMAGDSFWFANKMLTIKEVF